VRCLYDRVGKIYACPLCGKSFTVDEYDSSQLYSNGGGVSNLTDISPSFHTPSAHNRTNHLIKYLDRMTGVDVTPIPPEVFDCINVELLNDGINVESIYFNSGLIKHYLKSNGLNKWIRYMAKIYKSYTGRNLIQPLTPLDRGRILNMWEGVQKHVTAYMSNDGKRRNFPSCWYFLRKMTEHLGIDIQINIFHVIKKDDNTKKLDTMWKYVCTRMDVPYVPTM